VAHEINTPLGYVRNNLELVHGMFTRALDLLSAYEKLIDPVAAAGLSEAELNARFSAVSKLSRAFHQDHVFEELQELFKDTIYGVDQISELVVNLKNFSRLDRSKPACVRLRIVVQEGDDLSGRLVQAAVPRPGEPQPRLMDIAQAAEALRPVTDHFAGPVPRSIVHDQYFVLLLTEGLAGEALQGPAQEGGPVERADDDGDAHYLRRPGPLVRGTRSNGDVGRENREGKSLRRGDRRPQSIARFRVEVPPAEDPAEHLPRNGQRQHPEQVWMGAHQIDQGDEAGRDREGGNDEVQPPPEIEMPGMDASTLSQQVPKGRHPHVDHCLGDIADGPSSRFHLRV